MNRPRLLNGCCKSVVLAEAFETMGFDAWTCDILPSEGWHKHIQDDVLKHLNDGWDIGIFHPPCTYLSYAATSSWNDEGRVWKRLEALDFFARLYTAPIERICVENPMGCASPTIAKYSQVIQPYYFGDTESKRTCLWLKNLPLLEHDPVDTMFYKATHVKPKVYAYYLTGKKKGQPIYGNNYLKFSEDRGEIRSRNYPGISQAMATQWGNYVLQALLSKGKELE